MAVSVHLRAEFNFINPSAAQHLKVQRLQGPLAVIIALLIYCLVSDAIYRGLLELLLLLVLLRARQSMTSAASIESLVLQDKNARASINGQHYSLSACRLDYFSRWLSVLRLTTVAGQTYRCYISPDVLGAVNYRQLIAALKAKAF